MKSSDLRSGVPGRNFYGRVMGKTLKPAQINAIDNDLPRLRLGNVSVAENAARLQIDPHAAFGAPGRPLWLEIGFGAGEHMVHQALTHPDIDLIGCEPFLNGVAMALGRIARAGAPNIRIHPGDARDLLDVLPEACVSCAFLLYPDPWPKARHHRRRFVTADHLRPLARALRPGAAFRVASDIADYIRQALREIPAAGFRRVEHPIDAPWPGWPSTRYEAKALREGRAPNYLTFIRE